MKGHPQWMLDLSYLAGSKNRLAVYTWIYQNPDCFAGDIAQGAGVSRPIASEMIKQLQDHQFVHGDLPPDMRRGRAVRYRVDGRKLAALRRAFLTHLGES